MGVFQKFNITTINQGFIDVTTPVKIRILRIAGNGFKNFNSLPAALSI